MVPTTWNDEILLNCHDAVEGEHQGVVQTYHRVKTDYYRTRLYANVANHVQSCEDCSTSKIKPHLKGYSSGKVLSDLLFQVVSMNFVIPLPMTRRGNTALFLFQDHFMVFVIAKSISATQALEVAQAFKENIFRRFGVLGSICHDRDPRNISEVFQNFADKMGTKSRATKHLLLARHVPCRLVE